MQTASVEKVAMVALLKERKLLAEVAASVNRKRAPGQDPATPKSGEREKEGDAA